MKIGFDAKRAFLNKTGLGNYSRSIIEGISDFNKENQIYLFTPKINLTNFNIKNPNINIIEPNKFNNPLYWRFTGLNKNIKKHKIDLYHGLSNEIPYKIEIPSVVTIHDLLFLKYPKLYSFFDRKLYQIKSHYACQKSNAIIATSQQTKDDIIQYLNINEKKIKVIYQTCHPVFQSNINDDIQDHLIKQAIQFPFILYVGSIEERKNLLFLLKSMLYLKKEIRLICVGKKTRYYKKVKHFIEKNKLENRVSFLNISKPRTLAILYKKSRGLVFPSLNEGFGIPIIEAMFSKIPVITSNQAIFREIAGKNSYFFEKEKIDSLVEKIKEVWMDSNKREMKIRENFNYVQKFNNTQQIEKIIYIYKSLISK